MEVSRTKTASKNIIFSFALHIYQIVIPFIVQTVLVYKLGVEYSGLNGLFKSILGIINLTELGFGTAAVFCLYEPVAKQDTGKICALLNFYKKCYRVIGIVILVVGGLCIPFLPGLIKSDLPDGLNLYLLYLFQLVGTASSYLLFAYKNNILVAYQKIDLTSKIGIGISTFKYVFQIGSLYLGDYYLYCIAIPLSNIISNIITSVIVDRMFPEYACRGSVDKKQLKILIEKIKALFIVKIGSVVLGAVDNVVISAFLGLTLLGHYNNYYYIFSAVTNIASLFTSAIISTLGNSLVTESREKNFKDFIQLSFWNHWLIGWFSICMICLYQHFVNLWLGEKNILPMGIVVLLAIYFYVIQSHQVAGAYKDAAGIWSEDKLRPFCVAMSNLIINILLVQYIGLYGIVLSTILSLLCLNTPWLIHNVHKLIFQRNSKKYAKMWGKNVIFTFVAAIICYWICGFFPIGGIKWFLVKLILCMLIPNLLYFLFYFKTYEFRENGVLIRKIFKNSLFLKF